MKISKAIDLLIGRIVQPSRNPLCTEAQVWSDFYSAVITGEGQDVYLRRYFPIETEAELKNRIAKPPTTPDIITRALQPYMQLNGIVTANELRSESEALPSLRAAVFNWSNREQSLFNLLLNDLYKTAAADANSVLVCDTERLVNPLTSELDPTLRSFSYYKVPSRYIFDYSKSGGNFVWLLVKYGAEWRLITSQHFIILTALKDTPAKSLPKLDGAVTFADGVPLLVSVGEGSYSLQITKHNFGRAPVWSVGWLESVYNDKLYASIFEGVRSLLEQLIIIGNEKTVILDMFLKPVRYIMTPKGCDVITESDCHSGSCNLRGCITCDKRNDLPHLYFGSQRVFQIEVSNDPLDWAAVDVKRLIYDHAPPQEVLAAIGARETEAIDRMMATLYGSDIYSKSDAQPVNETATAKMIDQRAMLSSLQSYVLHVVSLYRQMVGAVAVSLGVEQLDIILDYPKGLNVETLADMVDSLSNARAGGVSEVVLSGINAKILSLLYADQPKTLNTLLAISKHTPYFFGSPLDIQKIASLSSMQNDGERGLPNIVENYLLLHYTQVANALNELYENFAQLPYGEQAQIIMDYVTAQLDGIAEEAIDAEATT